MRKALSILVAIVGVSVVVAVLAAGCADYYVGYSHSFSRQAQTPAPPKAHGGTHNVNDAAFDAMFFKNYGVNPFIDADEDNLSTFAVDVDTGSYTLCRSYLVRGHLPHKDAVRVEEFINYFDYGYAPPKKPGDAFAIHTEAAPSNFGPGKILLKVAIKARHVKAAERKSAVLTFVIDVSGSMAREDRLELVKKALRMLVKQLHEGDQVGIAVYGSEGRKLLDHRSVEDRGEILAAIERLQPGGATNAEEGIIIGYRMAQKAFRAGAINRIILCSDGVANVGNTGPRAILRKIKKHADAGITLSTIGFGMGNYNDVLMEQLADKGNGNYAYVDTLSEARRVFVENLTGMLQLVARDVKVQVDFNPKVVRSYRLLGYENRDVADEDFRNDKVDGGEIGAGHSVTALYELKLWPEKQGRIATVTVRHKDVDGNDFHEVSRKVRTSDVSDKFADASASLRLAASVAEFAEILRESHWAKGGSLDDALVVARRCLTDYDDRKDVKELVRLIKEAARLKARQPEQPGLAGSSLEE